MYIGSEQFTREWQTYVLQLMDRVYLFRKGFSSNCSNSVGTENCSPNMRVNAVLPTPITPSITM